MIPSHFQFNNDSFMVVRPVQFMMNSSLIADHARRGDLFVVNLRTRSLTIMTKADQEKILCNVTEIVKPSDPKDLLHAVDVAFCRQKLRDIVRDARAALGE